MNVAPLVRDWKDRFEMWLAHDTCAGWKTIDQEKQSTLVLLRSFVFEEPIRTARDLRQFYDTIIQKTAFVDVGEMFNTIPKIDTIYLPIERAFLFVSASYNCYHLIFEKIDFDPKDVQNFSSWNPLELCTSNIIGSRIKNRTAQAMILILFEELQKVYEKEL